MLLSFIKRNLKLNHEIYILDSVYVWLMQLIGTY